MKFIKVLMICQLVVSAVYSQKKSLIPQENLSFLEGMTKDVLEASRIYPEQFISKEFGANNTGGMLIRPGGRDAYPSFWIRTMPCRLNWVYLEKGTRAYAAIDCINTMRPGVDYKRGKFCAVRCYCRPY